MSEIIGFQIFFSGQPGSTKNIIIFGNQANGTFSNRAKNTFIPFRCHTELRVTYRKKLTARLFWINKFFGKIIFFDKV